MSRYEVRRPNRSEPEDGRKANMLSSKARGTQYEYFMSDYLESEAVHVDNGKLEKVLDRNLPPDWIYTNRPGDPCSGELYIVLTYSEDGLIAKPHQHYYRCGTYEDSSPICLPYCVSRRVGVVRSNDQIYPIN